MLTGLQYGAFGAHGNLTPTHPPPQHTRPEWQSNCSRCNAMSGARKLSLPTASQTRGRCCSSPVAKVSVECCRKGV